MIHIGIIGCGSITKFRHAPEYFSNADAKIIGFFDPLKERAVEMCRQYGGRAYDSYELDELR